MFGGVPSDQSLPSFERVVAAFHREVVFLEHDARRLAGGPRTQFELHRGFAGSARAGEIVGEFLLVEFDVGRRLVIRAR